MCDLCSTFDHTYPKYVLDVGFWIEFRAIDIQLIRRLARHSYIFFVVVYRIRNADIFLEKKG